jgi:hypothetical protein
LRTQSVAEAKVIGAKELSERLGYPVFLIKNAKVATSGAILE